MPYELQLERESRSVPALTRAKWARKLGAILSDDDGEVYEWS